MGCVKSAEVAMDPVHEQSAEFEGISEFNAEMIEEALPITESFRDAIRARDDKIKYLDEMTKVPFIMVELTGEGEGLGEIEICGKNEYNILAELDNFFLNAEEGSIFHGCERMDVPGDERVPFCAAQYKWPGFRVEEGGEGMNNMGLATMKLIDFVAGKLSWTLAVIAGGNVGKEGEVREQQVVFKSPHPSNLVVPHMLVELRSAGYIEVCADLDEEHQDTLEKLEDFFAERFNATVEPGHEAFCDKYFKIGEDVIKGDDMIDSNWGILAIDVSDFIVRNLHGWSIVASNASNYGAVGEHVYQEQQLVFRCDNHPLGKSRFLQVCLNSSGLVEVSGKDTRGVLKKLDKHITSRWNCTRHPELREGSTLCRRWNWPRPQELKTEGKEMNLLLPTTEMIRLFEYEGFELQVCSQSTLKDMDEEDNLVTSREQQLVFRPGRADSKGVVLPHLLVELNLGEGREDLFQDETEPTQVLANQGAEVLAVSPKDRRIVNEAFKKLEEFFVQYLGGVRDQAVDEQEGGRGLRRYKLNIFLCRGRYENNMARWTMRVCDFMVDHLGWSFLCCSLCNRGDYGQQRLQQMVFRWDGDKREVPQSLSLDNMDLSAYQETPLPDFWKAPPVLERQLHQMAMPCDEEEKAALQVMMDVSFKRVLTRDRQPDEDDGEGEEIPFRLQLVHAFRSENIVEYAQLMQCQDWRFVDEDEHENFSVKTSVEGSVLVDRLSRGEAYLFHGTNPSSAMSILKTGFSMEHAGKATGTMFGAGIYLAEASSKSDEYGRDDGGNTYPSLNALLVCRCFVGKPHVVQDAGNHIEHAKQQGMHCVVGDRESAVGTYREFIFYNEDQIYPEYTVIYRRIWEKQDVPEELQDKMIVPKKGTTGRLWQIQKRGSDWESIQMDLGGLITEAYKAEEETITLNFKGQSFVFELKDMKATAEDGTTYRMRKPMVM